MLELVCISLAFFGVLYFAYSYDKDSTKNFTIHTNIPRLICHRKYKVYEETYRNYSIHNTMISNIIDIISNPITFKKLPNMASETILDIDVFAPNINNIYEGEIKFCKKVLYNNKISNVIDNAVDTIFETIKSRDSVCLGYVIMTSIDENQRNILILNIYNDENKIKYFRTSITN
jgi:hypothetical protein